MKHAVSTFGTGRRVAALLLATLLLAAVIPNAAADVIWEPQDSFYEKHQAECAYHGRNYLTNGEEGGVTVWEAPGSSRKVATIANGIKFYVHFTYEDAAGADWGLVEFSLEDGKVLAGSALTGWIKMEELALIRDATAFAQDHQEEFHAYEGDYSALSGGEVLLWTYPGSGSLAGTIADASQLRFDHAYTDAEGREWGYVGYYMGQRDVWICVSAPRDADLPADEPAQPALRTPAPGQEVENAVYPGGGSTLLLVGGLVAAAVVGTALLIRDVYKKREQ